mgnify:CR=1 FL=1
MERNVLASAKVENKDQQSFLLCQTKTMLRNRKNTENQNTLKSPPT